MAIKITPNGLFIFLFFKSIRKTPNPKIKGERNRLNNSIMKGTNKTKLFTA